MSSLARYSTRSGGAGPTRCWMFIALIYTLNSPEVSAMSIERQGILARSKWSGTSSAGSCVVRNESGNSAGGSVLPSSYETSTPTTGCTSAASTSTPGASPTSPASSTNSTISNTSETMSAGAGGGSTLPTNTSTDFSYSVGTAMTSAVASASNQAPDSASSPQAAIAASRTNTGTIAGAVIGGTVGLLLVLLAAFIYLRGRARKRHTPPSAEFLSQKFRPQSPPLPSRPSLGVTAFTVDRENDYPPEDLPPPWSQGSCTDPILEKVHEIEAWRQKLEANDQAEY